MKPNTQSTDASGSSDTRKAFNLHHAVVVEKRGDFVALGEALASIRRDDLWKAGPYRSWEAYCALELGCSKAYANRLIKSSEIMKELNPILKAKELVPPMNEAQVRPLAKLSTPKAQADAWKKAVGIADGRAPTADIVSHVVRGLVLVGDHPKAPTGKEQKLTEIFGQLEEGIRSSGSPDELLKLLLELRLFVIPAPRQSESSTAAQKAVVARNENGKPEGETTIKKESKHQTREASSPRSGKPVTTTPRKPRKKAA
ncbi:hypothetical protein [Luteolibacter sp. LG18]|uniref:hypothetical protein n=1 Tax=Luteolibacter sp. LG18 TaxID=2819286 RepID=UPI002B2E1EAF|nr:hypothetical protein llg_15800 [Luteolibacter sp. LG18]